MLSKKLIGLKYPYKLQSSPIGQTPLWNGEIPLKALWAGNLLKFKEKIFANTDCSSLWKHNIIYAQEWRENQEITGIPRELWYICNSHDNNQRSFTFF